MTRAQSYRARRFVLLALILVSAALAANLYWGRADPVLGEAKAPIMLTWTTDSLLPELAEAAREVDGIGAVATARNGLGWLTSWSAEGGTPVRPPAGFMVPIEVLAVVPDAYSDFVPESYKDQFEALASGGALLGESGAALRDIEAKGSLTFGETTIQVAGVVPDELISSHEVVMSLDTTKTLGISDLRYVLVELERGTDRDTAEQALRAKLPEGARLDTRAPGDAEVFRPGGKILPQVEIKKRFGEFAGRPGSGRNLTVDPAWVARNTSNVTFPILGETRCNNKMIPVIREALKEVADQKLSGLIRNNDSGGCFAPRFLNSDPQSGISHHAWGIAFDFNVSQNPYGIKPRMDMRLVELLEKRGLAWGGRWGEPDGMHFEYLKEP